MLLFEINTKTRGFETTPKIAKASNKSNTKRSGMQALRKSMTKIRGWSRRLGHGDKPYINDNRYFSSLLDNISGNVTIGDSKFSIRQQWSQSVSDLFRTSHT
ncbi:unnamed protein product [Fusarium langsethiae]|nr:unnamed protein product [Fusarium langsethiae]